MQTETEVKPLNPTQADTAGSAMRRAVVSSAAAAVARTCLAVLPVTFAPHVTSFCACAYGPQCCVLSASHLLLPHVRCCNGRYSCGCALCLLRFSLQYASSCVVCRVSYAHCSPHCDCAHKKDTNSITAFNAIHKSISTSKTYFFCTKPKSNSSLQNHENSCGDQ